MSKWVAAMARVGWRVGWRAGDHLALLTEKSMTQSKSSF